MRQICAGLIFVLRGKLLGRNRKAEEIQKSGYRVKEQRKERRMRISKWSVSAWLTFLGVWIFQIVLNQWEPVMRSLPDEFGAVAAASYYAGCDWSYVLEQAGMYYGFGTGILFYPFFVWLKDPLLLYQVLLAGGAFLRSIPVFLVFDIYHNKMKYDKLPQVVLLGVIAVLIAPTRATNIDNEPMLILMGWLIAYLIICLQDSVGWKHIMQSALLAVILAYGGLVHTRSVIYVITVLVVCVLYHMVKKKALVNYPVLISLYAGGYFLAQRMVKQVQETVYVSTEMINGGVSDTPMTNTMENVTGSLPILIRQFFTLDGLRNWIELVCSNLWVGFVFTGGLLLAVIAGVCVLCGRKAAHVWGKRDSEPLYGAKEKIFFALLFAVVAYLLFLAGLGLLWGNEAQAVRENGEGIGRGFFYLRYTCSTMGPLIVLGLILLTESHLERIGTIVSMGVLLVTSQCTLWNGLRSSMQNGNYKGDWFGYFTPLSGSMTGWEDSAHPMQYYLIATIVAAVILLVVYGMCKRTVAVLVIIASLTIYQYTYSAVRWDGEYSQSENYYGAVDGLLSSGLSGEELFEGADYVYYDNVNWGTQFVVQFALGKLSVYYGLPQEDDADIIIMTNNADRVRGLLTYDTSEYVVYVLDENEYIMVNDAARIDHLNQIKQLRKYR